LSVLPSLSQWSSIVYDGLKSTYTGQHSEKTMGTPQTLPGINEELWSCSADQLANEVVGFVDEFGSFTPEWFSEVKFHLLKSGLTLESRDELCSVTIFTKQCRKCDHLYMAKKCLLWYRLFDVVNWGSVKRAPPCIRVSLKNKSIRVVADFLKRTNLIDPPFYKSRPLPTCKTMDSWGVCNPDQYCRAMKTGRILEYNKARERTKITRQL
jgi:hypothetical protein